MLQLDIAIQTAVATLAHIKGLKPEPEECVILFIKGKEIVASLLSGVWRKLNISAGTTGRKVGSIEIP